MTSFKGLEQDKIWLRYGFENLLIWLFLYLVVSPFVVEVPFVSHLVTVLFGAVLLFAVTAMNKKSRMLTPAIILLALTLILYVLSILELISFSLQGMLASKTLYLAILLYSFAQYIFTRKKVDIHLICAALCLYLIIGLMWGGFYYLLELIIPNSFSGFLLENISSHMSQQQHFNYFSFITMTTLGYGDITPQTNAASSLCLAEAIIGQFFTVVMIARLVGIQIAQEFS